LVTTLPKASTACTVTLKATPAVAFDGARLAKPAIAAAVIGMSRWL
jgi:hypothetical protein